MTDLNSMMRKELMADKLLRVVIDEANECLLRREDLLRRCAEQFRFYERSHMIKAQNKTMKEPSREEARQKAEVNRKFAEEIEALLAESK